MSRPVTIDMFTSQGKVEMEVELVTEDEAKERPAAPARDEPNDNPHLEPPKSV